jgi:VWFA-related protein
VSSPRVLKIVLLTALLAGTCAFETGGQEPAQSETPSTTTPLTLKVERNEVPVRVVVRDAQGKPVRNLTRDDFRILDDGQPQVITHFSAEGAAVPIPGAAKAGGETKPSASPEVAHRFVVLYFDDLVMKFDEIARSRDAAMKYLQTSLRPSDRVAIYTSSGQRNLDFTADRDELQEALSHLRTVGVFAKAGGECPDLSDYEAYMIDERKDSDALAVATWKVINCQCGGEPKNCKDPSQMAQIAAARRWEQAQAQVLYSLLGLEKLVQQLSVLPGQRTVVFVSRGFISKTQLLMISEIIDRAVRAGVVVNGLDARGLYATVPGGDASQPEPSLPHGLLPRTVQMQLAEAQEDADVLAEVVDGTGGVFFHNNNDFDAGFRTTGGLAEFSYTIVFSPRDLQPNGKYHHLTVQLVGDAKASDLRVQARRGYFAPTAAQRSDWADQEDRASGGKVSITDLSAPKKAQNEYEKGQRAFKKESLPEARRHLENAVAEYPCYARAQTSLGMTLELLSESAAAESAFRKAVECDSGFLEAHVQLGIFLNYQRRFAECAADLRKIIGSFPGSWQLSYQLAAAEYGLGQYPQSAQEYLRAESISSEVPAEIHVRLADVYTQQGAYAHAYVELQAYLHAEPQGRFAAKVTEVMQRMEKAGVLKRSPPPDVTSTPHKD